MPEFLKSVARFVTANQKDTAPVNSYEGFQGNGAIVLRDRRGTAKAEIPEISEKAFDGGNPLAIYKPTGAKAVSPQKAMASFNGWTFAAVNAIAREISNIQFRLYQVKGDDDHEELSDHPLLTLLDGVNEQMTGIELKYVMAAHLELTGNCYLLLDGVTSDTTPPRALYPLNPGSVRVHIQKDVFPYRLDYYTFTVDNKVFTFQPHQILHLKYPDPNDPFVGIGFVQSIPSWIDSDNYLMEYNRKYFINGAQIGLYIQTDTNVEGNIDRIRKSWENRQEGVQNAHRTPVLPKGVKLEHTGVTHKDMDFSTLADVTRDRILAAAGVSKTILGTAESDTNRACHDDQTEVLTENGWKKYFEVKDGEKIAEYDGFNNVIRFAIPVGKYVYPYKGKMIHFENCKMDIMVTPDHRMWYRPDHKGAEYRIGLAEKLPKICYFKAAAPQNDGEEIDLFTLPYYPKGSHPEIIGRTFYMDDWLEFLGYVISEGGISSQAKNWVITLYQKKQPHLDKIRACLKRLQTSGCISIGEYQTPGEDGYRFNVHGKPVVMWMHEFVGSYCKDKRIPDFVFKLCRRQRQIVFNALMLGDGSINSGPNDRSGYYSTTSHQLADNMQRLALSLGYEARVGVHYEASGNRNTCYRVSLEFGDAEQQLDWQHRGMKHEIDYDGYVWCFQTTTGLFVTRRNGKIALQGNTSETADYVFSKRTIKPKMLLIISYFNEFLVPRYGDDLYLTFIDPMPEDKAARTTEMNAAAGAGVPLMTQNEARKNYLGLGPVDGGDQLLRPAALEPIGVTQQPEGEDPTPQLVKSKTVDGWETKTVRVRTGGKTAQSAGAQMRRALTEAFKKTIDKTTAYQFKSINELTHAEYAEHWKRFADRSEQAEADLQKIFRGINAKQREQVIENLSEATGIKSAFGVEYSEKALDELFDVKEWIGITINLATPILAGLTADEAASAFAMIGVSNQNILADESTQMALNRGISKMATSYNETTLEQLKNVLGEKLTQSGGTNLTELTEAVDAVYSYADEKRAALIAKTESFRAANWANKEAWRASGVVQTVKWYTADDGKVCQFCQAQDGKEIPIDQNFYEAGDPIGGSEGGVMTANYGDIECPPLHPDCRCYIRPESVE